MEEVTGKIKQFIFRKDDYIIALFKSQENQQFTVKGSMLGIEADELITLIGFFENHPKYGRQFSIHQWKKPVPVTKTQIIEFLSSKLIKGCGKKNASLIVDHLGENTLEIIMNDGVIALSSIKGIGKKRAQSIVNSIKDTFEIQNIMMELMPYGITSNMVIKAYKEFGPNTLNIIRQNPYQLTRLSLVGFVKADEIARKMGISPLSTYRVESCADYVLKEKCFGLGHCYLQEDELVEETLKVLNHNVAEEECKLSKKEVDQAIALLEANNRLINENGQVYPRFLYEHEKRLAQKVSKLLNRSNSIPYPVSKIENAIKDYQRKEAIVLAEGQRKAIRELMNNNLLILTGGPGTGKTTVVKGMIAIYKSLNPNSVIGMAAPTGRASRKLTELTGLDASTIHRMIGYRHGEDPEMNEENPLSNDLLIIDEFSMTDVQIADYLFQAIAMNTKVLLVGDSDQLPSVNAGNVLKDLLEAGVPQVRLTEIFRQAQESQIIMNAHLINNGQPISVDHSKGDFYFIKQENPEQIADTIKRSVLRFQELGFSAADMMVLSPMKKGVIGIQELNRMLQETLNGPSPYKKELKHGETIFREDDKVIQIKNNREKDVYNGDVGTITRIDHYIDEDGNTSSDKAIYCQFHGREVIYTKDEINELQLAYSITIHKSQGGQAPIVIIPVSTSHFIMLARNLIYTGITRAEKKVVLIGTEKALNIAIKNNKIVQRNTNLTERIVQYRLHSHEKTVAVR